MKYWGPNLADISLHFLGAMLSLRLPYSKQNSTFRSFSRLENMHALGTVTLVHSGNFGQAPRTTQAKTKAPLYCFCPRVARRFTEIPTMKYHLSRIDALIRCRYSAVSMRLAYRPLGTGQLRI